MTLTPDDLLPMIDDPPEEWGPDHDDLELTEDEIVAGNEAGETEPDVEG